MVFSYRTVQPGGGFSNIDRTSTNGTNGTSRLVSIPTITTTPPTPTPTITPTPTPIGIVTSGQQVYFNANDPISYPGSGTTWFDLSGTNAHATLYNSPVYNNTTPKSFSFDGINDYGVGLASTPFSASPVASFTQNVWINRMVGSSQQYIVGFVSQTPSLSNAVFGIGILFNYVSWNGQLTAYSGVDGGTFYAAGQIALNTWYNLCITHQQGEFVNLYINGVLVDSLAVPTWGGTYPGVNNLQRVVIGDDWTGGGSLPFAGKIGAVQSYIRKLSSAEVLQNFNALRSTFGL